MSRTGRDAGVVNLRILKDTPPWEWPDGTREGLLDVLRDDGAGESDLLLAAELAGDLTVIDDELVEALLSVLRAGGRSEAVRGRAAISLGPVLEHADTQGFEDADDLPITERAFHGLRESLRTLYRDADVPKGVRRRILEASVRAPEDWHEDAIRAAYAGGDELWRLTAVFCMRFVRGFDAQILEALDSQDPDVHYEAVVAAGNWGVDAAWRHVAALVTSKETDKALRLAAIEAIATIRPREAGRMLDDLADSHDEDIAAAAEEAMAVADGARGEDDDDDDCPF
jgi:HEAT repeat protein